MDESSSSFFRLSHLGYVHKILGVKGFFYALGYPYLT
jgi:hypothetical protein